MSSPAILEKKVRVKSARKKSSGSLKKAPKGKKARTSNSFSGSANVLTKAKIVREVTREPLGHLMLEHLLREAGFKGEVSSRKELLDEYSVDESIFSIRPQIVLQPVDAKDVEIAVSVTSSATHNFPSLSLTPRAAGTGLGGGSLTDSVVIDIKKHLNKILRISKVGSSVTFTCEPGAMWRDVEKALKEYDVYLPPYPASKQICTIGGSVANNAAGPDSLRYGHVVDWIESMQVVLRDGETYKITPLSYNEFKKLIKKKNALATTSKEIFELIEENEMAIKKARPKTVKNTAGYPLWDVINTSVADFKKGKGFFNLIRLLAGSQGTIGIITSITMRTEPIARGTHLLTVPVFSLSTAGKVVLEAIKHDPINVEIFDALTYESAMKNPQFFRERLGTVEYYKIMFSMYATYHVRWNKTLPEFVLLITLDENKLKENNQTAKEVVDKLNETILHSKNIFGLVSKNKPKLGQARLIESTVEREMFWQIRDASFSLSKLLDPHKRPAAFLEDMTVPPEHLGKFFSDIKYLLKKYNIKAAVHGHGGNAHFHFYPLLDFTNRTTPALIKKMSEEFFATAIKYQGSICGEHNDGIIRTPYLHLMFSKKILDLFEKTEQIFDPDDIFNPGKKTRPRFDITTVIRQSN